MTTNLNLKKKKNNKYYKYIILNHLSGLVLMLNVLDVFVMLVVIAEVLWSVSVFIDAVAECVLVLSFVHHGSFIFVHEVGQPV